MDKHATVTAYTASSGAVLFGLSANELAAVVGAAVAVLTFLVNVWFKRQHLKLARKALEEGRLRPDKD